jgi:amino acid transporter
VSETDPDRLEHELLEAESVEALKARLEREHNELLQELRSLIPGANVLLGFLLAVSFTNEFGDLDRAERYVYFATLVSTAVAIVLFMAPAAHHRLRFREGDKDNILRKGNREAIAGTVASSFALTGVLYIITSIEFGTTEAIVASLAFFAFTAWRWWSYALYRVLKSR